MNTETSSPEEIADRLSPEQREHLARREIERDDVGASLVEMGLAMLKRDPPFTTIVRTKRGRAVADVLARKTGAR